MSAPRWEEVKGIFHELVELDGKERSLRLKVLQRENPAVAAEVKSLLAAGDEENAALEFSLVDDLVRSRAVGHGGREKEAAPYRRGFQGETGFEILRPLGSGGVAEVFLARRLGPEGFEKRLAVKRLLPAYGEDQGFREQFAYEARLSSRLTHPNIAQVFDFAFADGHYWLSMEFVDGKNLSQLLRRLKERGETLPPEVAAWLVAEVCRGLAYAHSLVDDRNGEPLGIIHRDVSPKNVMIGYGGEVKIVDFGIANARDRVRITATGDLRGTVAYMSPEQAKGKKLDARSDVYSSGALLFECLAAEPLLVETDPLTVLDIARKGTRAAARIGQLKAPEPLKRLLRKALAPDPRRRYPDAGSLCHALAESLGEGGDKEARETLARIARRAFAAEIEAERRAEWAPKGAEGAHYISAGGRFSRNPLRRPLPPMVAGAMLFLASVTVAALVLWWRPMLRPWSLDGEAPATVPGALLPAAACGAHFDSVPNGAQLALNGVLLGTTPLASEMPCDVAADLDLTYPGQEAARYLVKARGRQGRLVVTLFPAGRGIAARRGNQPVPPLEVLYEESDNSTVVARRRPATIQPGDGVCLAPKGESLRCGRVLAVTRTEATVLVTSRSESLDVEPR